MGTDSPSYGEIDFWSAVFETYRKVMGAASKPKTQAQIVKWLKDPYSDASEYKMWGNGVALPCVCFVLSDVYKRQVFVTAMSNSILCVSCAKPKVSLYLPRKSITRYLSPREVLMQEII